MSVPEFFITATSEGNAQKAEARAKMYFVGNQSQGTDRVTKVVRFGCTIIITGVPRTSYTNHAFSELRCTAFDSPPEDEREIRRQLR